MSQTPTQTGFFSDAQRVVGPLCASLRELIDPHPDSARGPLAINPTLRSRVTRGIGSNHVPSILYHLPGPDGLRRVLSACKRAGAGADLLALCGRRIDAYEAFLRDERVSRDELQAMVGGLAPEARLSVVRTNAQAVHKAMSNLIGYSAETMLVALLILPGRSAGRCDMAQVSGFVGLRHLRSGAWFMTSGYGRTGGQAGRPRTLDGEPADENASSTLLVDFCSDPLPVFEARHYGRRQVYRLADGAVGTRSSATFFFGELVGDAYPDPPEPADGAPARAMISAIMATPSKRLHFDVFVHRDVWTGHDARLDTFRTVPHGPVDESAVDEREVDRIDLGAELQRFDSAPLGLGASGVPRYSEMIAGATARLGVEPDALRLYRCEMTYPLHGTQVAMRFEPA